MTGRSWTAGTASLSECGTYRYALRRRWAADPMTPALTFVMLNPSTADATLDDPTIRRCIGFAKREGYGAVKVLNLYAFRATNPKALLTCDDPVGPENDDYLDSACLATPGRVPVVVAAWGVHARPDRVAAVLELGEGADWRCLGTTKDGHPRHPLYVRGDQPLLPFSLSADASDPNPLCPKHLDNVHLTLSCWDHPSDHASDGTADAGR